MKASQVVCTVGTSIFGRNLARLPEPQKYPEWLEQQPPQDRPYLDQKRIESMREAYAEQAWSTLAALLHEVPPETRILGAEINSIQELIVRGHVEPSARVYFLHSDTEEGRHVAAILEAFYSDRSECHQISGLDDRDPERFRTQGLRSLAKTMGKIIRDQGAANCAVNATGGYKAQIAIAVVVGQVTGVPVYYKHERFSAIIALPPLPISFDFSEWFRCSSFLYELAKDDVPARFFGEDAFSSKAESLIDRVEIDGEEYLTLSPLGQVFHDTFRDRYQGAKARFLPSAAKNKKKPRFENAGWPGTHPEFDRFVHRVTDEVPQVISCATYYYNPDCVERTRFRLGSQGVEGIYSNGSYTAKFRIETTATTKSQKEAVVAELNDWLEQNR